MNAYSSISKRRVSRFRRRLRSPAYRSGLTEGFGATTLLFSDFSFKRSAGVDSSIATAWKTVGDALKEASKMRGSGVGETTRETEPTD